MAFQAVGRGRLPCELPSCCQTGDLEVRRWTGRAQTRSRCSVSEVSFLDVHVMRSTGVFRRAACLAWWSAVSKSPPPMSQRLTTYGTSVTGRPAEWNTGPSTARLNPTPTLAPSMLASWAANSGWKCRAVCSRAPASLSAITVRPIDHPLACKTLKQG
eukprot:70891-Rhodomonas_salina.2